MVEFWSKIAQQVAGGSRTDVLRSLIWPNALLLGALVWAGTRGAPMFILVLLSALLVLFMLLYGGAYIAFGRIDPNLLRSERFNLEKMAIERGVYGDSTKGLLEAPKPDSDLGAVNLTEKDR
jgi:hypothetical protein